MRNTIDPEKQMNDSIVFLNAAIEALNKTGIKFVTVAFECPVCKEIATGIRYPHHDRAYGISCSCPKCNRDMIS